MPTLHALITDYGFPNLRHEEEVMGLARGMAAEEVGPGGGEHHLRRIGDGLGRVPHQFIWFALRPQQGLFRTANLVHGEDGFHAPEPTSAGKPLTVTRRNSG